MAETALVMASQAKVAVREAITRMATKLKTAAVIRNQALAVVNQVAMQIAQVNQAAVPDAHQQAENLNVVNARNQIRERTK